MILMKNALTQIFRKDRGVIIGALHLPPLPGYPDFPGINVAIENALKDLRALEDGGVDGVIFENNYDIPHTEFVSTEVADAMETVGKRLRQATKLPLGVSVLWNDYRTALTIAKALGCQFIRVPVFVDTVEASCGVIRGEPSEVVSYRKKINGEAIALFTDVHVKHSKLLSPYSLEESAVRAVSQGADVLIVTGNWTGESPDLTHLKRVRSVVGDFPILVGSGLKKENKKELFSIANGAIVSTSLKDGGAKIDEVNVKSYAQRVDINKVRQLVAI